MCTFCGEHCVEDEYYRLSPKEIKSGNNVSENICPDKLKNEKKKRKYNETSKWLPNNS